MKFGLKIVLISRFFFLFHAKLKKTNNNKTNKPKQKTEYLAGINYSYLTTYLHAKTIILSLDIWKMEYM